MIELPEAPAPLLTGPASGALEFARFAAPPNLLGYCGGDDRAGLVDRLHDGVADPDLVTLCRSFEGAWPYLELISASSGIADPLDRRVVEAYWIGNRLLDAVSPTGFSADLETRFRSRTARTEWPWLAAKPARGARPHHSFHVLEVMPRIGMLRAGQIAGILPAMEQCLIRPGRVVAAGEDALTVRVAPLLMRSGKLSFGSPVEQQLELNADGLRTGDVIAVHWNRSCGRLSADQDRRLRCVTAEALRRANETC
jgi:hypothetical protein